MKCSVRLCCVLIASCTLLAGCSPPDEPDSGSQQPGATAEVRAAGNPYEPVGAERDEIVAVLQTVFDALEAGDGALLRSVIAPGTALSFAETRDGTTTSQTLTVDALATRIESSDVPLIERMWDPVVLRDGPLATIWTPYDFYSGTEFSHCGIDVATLVQGEDGWRIVGLSWTRDQPPACDLHPDGPPAEGA